MARSTGFERFFLYGEAPRAAGPRFAHVEFLDDRSRPANWVIKAHAHPDLHQIFLLNVGGGMAQADAGEIRLAAPCVVVVPAGVVHGFRWARSAEGRVLTFADAFLREIAARAPELSTQFAQDLWTATVEGPRIGEAFARLSQELSWAASGHDLAVEAHLAIVLIETLRLRRRADQMAVLPPGAQALLVAKFREVVEMRFRNQPSVAACARQLGVTPERLRAACRNVTGQSPSRILQERIVLEASRLLRYSGMGVAQVSRYLGFADPAYFSRFFARRCGASPRDYRRNMRTRLPPAQLV